MVVEQVVFHVFADPVTQSHTGLELAFGLIAPVEETAKFAIIQHEVAYPKNLGQRGVAVVGMSVGAGFAVLENLDYMLNANTPWHEIAVARWSGRFRRCRGRC